MDKYSLTKSSEILNPKEQLINKLIKKGFWLYFFTYLSAPLRYITRIIISNSPNVSVAEFGVLYGIISLITLLYTYNDLGLTESLQFFLPRFYLRKQFDNIKTTIYVSLFIQIITGIIIASGLWFGSEWLALNYFKSETANTVLKYFCFYFIGTNILQVIQTIFSAFQKTFESKLIEFVKVLSITIFTIFFFIIGKDNTEFYSFSRLLGIVIAIIIAALIYQKYRNSIIKGSIKRNKSVLNKYMKYTLWALIGNSIRNLFGQIILQMVVYLLGVESAGYYSNFLSLYGIGITVLRPIRSLIYPITSEYDETSNNQAIEKLIHIFYNYFSVIALSFSILMIVLGPEISVALFGEKYLLSGELLSYAGIFLIFNLLASFNSQILTGLGKVKERVIITGTACLITIIIAIVGIKLNGINGACIAFGISHIVNWILSSLFLKEKGYKFKTNGNFLTKNIILLLILGLIIYSVKSYIITTTGNRLLTITGLIIFSIIFYFIIGFINRKEIAKCRKIYRKY